MSNTLYEGKAVSVRWILMLIVHLRSSYFTHSSDSDVDQNSFGFAVPCLLPFFGFVTFGIRCKRLLKARSFLASVRSSFSVINLLTYLLSYKLLEWHASDIPFRWSSRSLSNCNPVVGLQRAREKIRWYAPPRLATELTIVVKNRRYCARKWRHYDVTRSRSHVKCKFKFCWR